MTIFTRCIAAIIGGYVLANCLSILLAIILPIPKPDAVVVGYLLIFVIYAGAIIWAFSAKTTFKAWLGLLLPSLGCAIAVYVLLPKG